jgi:phage shock protein C
MAHFIGFIISVIVPFIVASFAGKLLGFYKSESDQVLLGVCSGIADRLEVSPGILRLIWLVAVFFWGQGIWWYLAFALVLPSGQKHNS